MKKIAKNIVWIALMTCGLTAPVWANNAPETTAKASAVSGRILDNELQTLPGATIFVEELNSGTISDINGFYSLPNLKPGKYHIEVTYIGYEPYTTEITVDASGKTTVTNITLGESSQALAEVTVKGVMDQQRRALNAQKSNLGVTNVVSADQVGKFPDSNIGDALKRIPGINVQYDQGEARFGQVRGTSPDFTSVTINGSRMPSAEDGARNVQLDLIPADMIQTIEVNKVVTPDMDADAIGGSVNLVTKNSPTRRSISATAGSGYNAIANQAQLNLGFTYGDTFLNDKLGLILSASYQNAPQGSDNTEFEWEEEEENGLKEMQIRQYFLTRERQSYSAALNYDFNTNNKIYLKGIYNLRNDWENRYRTTIEKDGDEYEVKIQTKGGSADNRNTRLEKQQTMDYTLGGEHTFGRLEMDWKGSYAKATEDRPNERYIVYKASGLSFTEDFSVAQHPTLVPTAGSSFHLDDSYKLKDLTEECGAIAEDDLKGAIDFKLNMKEGEFANKLSFGGKIANKNKSAEKVYFNAYEDAVDEEKLNAMAHLVNNQRPADQYYPGSTYAMGNFVDPEYLGSIDFNNSSLFDKNEVVSVEEELAGDYLAREMVTAGYLRFDQKLGHNIDMMAGLRVENTYLEYSGSKYDVDNDKTTTTPTENNSYTNLLPSLMFKYAPENNLVVRAAYTNTLARPRYSDLAPSMEISVDDNEIKKGNSQLKPTISHNIDLLGEYYFKSVGLVSAGLFYKDINGFIADQTLTGDNAIYNNHQYDKIKTPLNGGDATLLGAEIAIQRDLSFISPSLKCLGVYGNYTYTHSQVSNFHDAEREDASELALPGSPKHTANASLNFDKAGFTLRLSYNYASSFIDELGDNKWGDIYYDAVQYVDINASYTFLKNFTVFADATNLLNTPLRYYQGVEERTYQVEYYGPRVNAGIKATF